MLLRRHGHFEGTKEGTKGPRGGIQGVREGLEWETAVRVKKWGVILGLRPAPGATHAKEKGDEGYGKYKSQPTYKAYKQHQSAFSVWGV